MGATNKGKFAGGGELIPYRDGGPGHRGVDTSIAAALKIQPAAASIESRLEEAIRRSGEHGATSDEAAAAIGLERWKARPRTTGLKNRGAIKDSGRRRDSESGVSSIVWTYIPPDKRDPAPANGQTTHTTAVE